MTCTPFIMTWMSLIEPADLATLGGADGVVGQIDEDAQQLVPVAVIVLAHQALELLGSMDRTDIQRSGQIGTGVVDAAAVHVACPVL